MFKNSSTRVVALAVLLVVQLGVAALVYAPRLGFGAGADTAEPAALFADLDPAAIERIRLHWDGDTLALARADAAGAEGSGWVLPDAGNYPVIEANVTSLISDVTTLDTSRLVATSAESHARLRVSETNPIRQVDIGLSSGVTETLYIGTSPNARATNVRRAGSDNVYLARDLDTTDVQMNAGGWVDTTFLTFDPATVQALTVENANGAFALARDESGAWSLEGLGEEEELISSTVESWVSTLSSLPMLEPLGREPQPAWGLETPQATVTLMMSDTEATVLTIGARDPSNDSLAAMLSTSPWIVSVTGSLLDGILNADRTTLVSAPPTPVVLPITTPASEAITGTAPLTATAAVTETDPVTEAEPVTEAKPVTP